MHRLSLVLLAQGIEALGVFARAAADRGWSRADDDQQALIVTGQNGFYIVAGIQQVLGDGVV